MPSPDVVVLGGWGDKKIDGRGSRVSGADNGGLTTQTCMRPNSSLRDVFRPKTSTVDVLAWHLWAAPLMVYGAVLRTPLPRVHYLTICLLKNVLTSALPPLVEVAARDNSGREMGVMEAVNIFVLTRSCDINLHSVRPRCKV